MTTDLDTLLTELYVLIDDHVTAPAQRRPGAPKRLSDAERVTLAVAQVPDHPPGRGTPGEPKPDATTTMLLDATVHGEPLSHDDLVGLITLVLFGGLDTTTTRLSMAMLYLLDHPERWEALRADPDLLDTGIEEVIRWSTPVQATALTVTQDLEVAGCPMAAGDRVLLLWGPANHQERQFGDPDDFVLDRSPNEHVGFGFGSHRCPGAPLAKVMLKISLAAVLARPPGLQRVTQDVVWTPGEAKNIRELRVRRTPANAVERTGTLPPRWPSCARRRGTVWRSRRRNSSKRCGPRVRRV